MKNKPIIKKNSPRASEQTHIITSVRIRPLLRTEKSQQKIIQTENSSIVLKQPRKAIRNPRNPRNYQYSFHNVFPAQSSNLDIFHQTAEDLINQVLSGFNATIFAYGSTGSGKTHTMLGLPSDPGIISNSISQLFSGIKAANREFMLKISYLEIYNEEIADLLSDRSAPLLIREDSKQGVIITGLSQLIPKSSQDALKALSEGQSRRKTHKTDANEQSSRSHAIFSVFLQSTGEDCVHFGKLSLVDLAGAERAAKTHNKGLRLAEGANINKSLLSLASCITALASQQKKHIPYRNSKLTRILKHSLDGSCRTQMIACVSPGEDSYEDTYHTLNYASRAKRIKLSVQRNVLNRSDESGKYVEIIEALKKQLNEYRRLDFPIQDQILALNSHFRRELETRKLIQETQCRIDSYQYELFQKQMAFEEVHEIALGIQIKTIADIIDQNKRQIDELYRRLGNLEEQRQEFPLDWAQNLPQITIRELESKMQSHIFDLQRLDSHTQEVRCEAIVDQKDLIIEMLTRQLKKRDKVVMKANEYFLSNRIDAPPRFAEKLQRLRSLGEIHGHLGKLPKIRQTTSRPTSPGMSPRSALQLRRHGSPLVRHGGIKRKLNDL